MTYGGNFGNALFRKENNHKSVNDLLKSMREFTNWTDRLSIWFKLSILRKHTIEYRWGLSSVSKIKKLS